MKPRSALVRLLFGGLLLCTLLLGVGARAATAEPEARLAEPMATMSRGHSIVEVTDHPQCIGCYIAPAPSLHGFSGETQRPDEQAWPLHANEPHAPTRTFDDGGRRASMPARIAFCRWLD